MTAVIDLPLRRPSAPRDARTVIDGIVERAESLHASAPAWPLTEVRESAIVGVERHMPALSVLLNDLRQHTPIGSEGGNDGA